MIDRAALLSDLQKLLQRLEADLLERSESADVPEVGKTLRAEYDRAKTAERTAQNYEDWRTDAITQAAAAWVLSCVFVRFVEDNRLIDPPKIAGPDERLVRARDEWELYLSKAQQPNERDYLLAVFDQLAKLPGAKDVFSEHNPTRELPNWLSGDAAKQLLDFFQRIDANTGALVHDFTDPNWDTRFLGDLYQDLSEAARKKYALLQTPDFVEEFILNRTLNPALDEFGLVVSGQSSVISSETDNRQLTTDSCFKMIDPACGSGHFLLGAFRRILDRWEKVDPTAKCRVVVQRALDSIYGVDVNPYAVAIARFRLLLVALKECGVVRLSDAPAFRINVVCGDSLLHAPLRGGQQVLDFELTSGSNNNDDRECEHAYQSEDLPELKRILRSGQYHTVMANPPYITPKDRQLNDRYRRRFRSCHMKYSLSVPFLERIFQLAVPGGYTGQITANSFMKREFGKKLIEAFFPTVDLTHVIDSQLAHIPGHGTSTVILFGRHRTPIASQIRLVGAIKREDDEPTDPAKGLVWSAIVAQVDQPGSQSEFVSVGDSPREMFHKHPWSIGGGGAAELKERLEDLCETKLDADSDVIGITSVTGEDELYMQPLNALRRRGVECTCWLVAGDVVRDWKIELSESSIWLYDENFSLIKLDSLVNTARLMWQYRAAISQRRRFGTPMIQRGLAWYEWQELYTDKLRTPSSIVFCEVATHNHFVLDRGGKVYKQTAPVIKLPAEASENDHLAILGLLNSSIGGFWIKQVCHCKGGGGIGGGIAAESWERFFAFNGTKLEQFPLPADRPLITARLLDSLAVNAAAFRPASLAATGAPTRRALDIAKSAAQFARSQMIAAQEELDWECYRLYGLIDSPVTRTIENVSASSGQSLEATALGAFVGLELGQRAFEIVMARKMARGELQTTWFERHGSTPITELPAEWPADYRQLVERRIALIESNPNIRLIEQPEYKRRWNTEPWESQLERALREWLLDRLESYFDFDGRMRDERSARVSDPADTPERRSPGGAGVVVDTGDLRSVSGAGSGDPRTAPGRSTAKLDIALVSVAKLADVARQDAEFQQVGELYRDDPAFDVQALVTELVEAESVPLLPILKYKPSGLRKRAEWERTWELQREEDNLERQRDEARRKIVQREEQIKQTLQTHYDELRDMRAQLLKLCQQMQRDQAPNTKLAQGVEPEVVAVFLLAQGFELRGLELAELIQEQEEEVSKKVREIKSLLQKRCEEDTGYQIAIEERDAIPQNPEIATPPKYISADFISTGGARYWSLRGKLDVPKERWISFPHCEGPDGTLVMAWAGYDHLQQARAISAYYVRVQTEFGGTDDARLIPLLAGLIELLPWLKQWHNEPDPAFDGMRMGDYFEGFVNEEVRQLGKTLPEIKAWQPPKKTARHKRK